MEPQKKKASPYSLSRESTEVKELSKLHKALNKKTN